MLRTLSSLYEVVLEAQGCKRCRCTQTLLDVQAQAKIAGDYSTSTKILERQALRERLFCSILYQQSKESNQGGLDGNTLLCHIAKYIRVSNPFYLI